MKKILIILLFYSITINSQVQIGNEILGIEWSLFGTEVVLSSDGKTLAIGGPQSYTGYVEVYKYIEEDWVKTGNFRGESFWDLFGEHISLSCDGSVIAIGAPGNEGNQTSGGTNVGSIEVYKYNKSNNSWNQIGQDLNGYGSEDIHDFPILSCDGNVVATHGKKGNKYRVYKNDNNNWVYADDVRVDNNGYHLLNLSLDGKTFTNLGKVNDTRVLQKFERSTNGHWVQSGPDYFFEELNFRTKIKLSRDGKTLAFSIGLKTNESDDYIDHGKVVTYRFVDNNWVKIGQEISEPVTNPNITLSKNGNFMALGNNNRNINTSNRVRVFKLESNLWVNINTIKYDDNDSQLDGLGGGGMSFSDDGNIIAIGYPTAPNGGDSRYVPGKVKVFDLSKSLKTKTFLSNTFVFYPNPASKEIKIELNNSILKEVSIYNNLGQFIKSSKKTAIDTSKLESGIYFLQVETNKGKSTKKLVIE